MSMARSSAPRLGGVASGAVRSTMASQVGNSLSALAGASGKAMQGMPTGTPGCCWSQVSSLPTNRAPASEWSST